MDSAGQVLKEFGYFSDYSQWDDTINAKAEQFYKVHNVHPNILLASATTFDKIDNYLKANPENLVYSGADSRRDSADVNNFPIGAGQRPDDDEPPPFDGLSHFTAADYQLDFCLDEEQPADYFILVFDETPTFDGEEEPEAEEEPCFYYKMAS